MSTRSPAAARAAARAARHGAAKAPNAPDAPSQRTAGQRVAARALESGETALLGLPPVASPQTRLLVLGSFPGVASLVAQQYYGHARNHFWPILGALWQLDLLAMPYAQRLQLMLDHGLGLWDTYASCQRQGSLDSAIRQAQPNDLAGLAARLPKLCAVAHNGTESARSMRLSAALGHPVYRLPSTSPANASWSFERKLAAWREVFAAHGLA